MGCIKSVILFKPTLSRAAGSLCNLCPHSKIVQLNKKININVQFTQFKIFSLTPSGIRSSLLSEILIYQFINQKMFLFNYFLTEKIVPHSEICILFRITKTLTLERDIIVDSLKCKFQMVIAAPSYLCSPPVYTSGDRSWISQNSAHEVKLNAWLDTIRSKIDQPIKTETTWFMNQVVLFPFNQFTEHFSSLKKSWSLQLYSFFHHLLRWTLL